MVTGGPQGSLDNGLLATYTNCISHLRKNSDETNTKTWWVRREHWNSSCRTSKPTCNAKLRPPSLRRSLRKMLIIKSRSRSLLLYFDPFPQIQHCQSCSPLVTITIILMIRHQRPTLSKSASLSLSLSMSSSDFCLIQCLSLSVYLSLSSETR